MYEGKEELRKIKNKYRNIFDKEKIINDLYVPCLKYCKEYFRCVGFYSSSALITWANALPYIISNHKDKKIKLLMSRKISGLDKNTILCISNKDSEVRREILKKSTESIILEAIEFSKNPNNKKQRMDLFCWLFAHKILEIKFAIPQHIEDAEDYHDKFGIFTFPEGDMISFNGSMNETFHGHHYNSETTRVLKNWESGKKEDVESDLDDFNNDWEGHEGLEVFELSEETKHKIIEHSPKELPFSIDDNEDEEEFIYDPKNDEYLNPIPQFDFQNEARELFIKNKYGILEMATGTGKTRTALSIVSDLLNSDLIDKVIIQMYGSDLLKQWYYKEIIPWLQSRQHQKIRVLRQTHKFYSSDNRNNQAEDFVNSFLSHSIKNILLIRKSEFANLLDQISHNNLSRTLIIHDEVHDLLTPEIKSLILDKQKNFGYRLGLSATVEKDHEQERNELLFKEVGPILKSKNFPFGVDKAIERGVLCEMNYVYLQYHLAPKESSKIQGYIAIRAKRKKENDWTPYDEKLHMIKVAKVRKLAENKIKVFDIFISKNKDFLHRCIIFVDEMQYGRRLFEKLINYTMFIRKHFELTDNDNISLFMKEKIHTILSCISLSQGINILSLNNIVLFATNSTLQTTQRLGRVLRINKNDPKKKATVIDFVDSDKFKEKKGSDYKRYEWLSSLSKTKTNPKYAHK